MVSPLVPAKIFPKKSKPARINSCKNSGNKQESQALVNCKTFFRRRKNWEKAEAERLFRLTIMHSRLLLRIAKAQGLCPLSSLLSITFLKVSWPSLAAYSSKTFKHCGFRYTAQWKAVRPSTFSDNSVLRSFFFNLLVNLSASLLRTKFSKCVCKELASPTTVNSIED